MALLTGMTADGLEVPVQVLPDGKLVAEGLEGKEGPPGNAAVISGTAIAPGLAAVGDPNTGLYGYGPDSIGFSTAGVSRGRITDSGNVVLGSETERGNWFNQVRRLDVVVEKPNAQCSAGIVNNRNDAGGANLVLAKCRGGVVGGAEIVSQGDNIGKVSYQAANGTNLIEVCQLNVGVDGPVDASSIPTALNIHLFRSATKQQDRVFAFRSSGVVNMCYTQTYADNVAAKAAGLVLGDLYTKADGTVMRVMT
jgi:hypothetical protein